MLTTSLPFPNGNSGSYVSSVLTIDTVIPREKIEKLPEPKIVEDKSKVFDLERECLAAQSRLHYSIEANASYELKKMQSLDKPKDISSHIKVTKYPIYETAKLDSHGRVPMTSQGGGGGVANMSRMVTGGWSVPGQGGAGKPMKFGHVE
jgi:hypothetical protein